MNHDRYLTDLLSQAIGMGGLPGWTDSVSIDRVIGELRLAVHLLELRSADVRILHADERNDLIREREGLQKELDQAMMIIEDLQARIERAEMIGHEDLTDEVAHDCQNCGGYHFPSEACVSS